METNTQSTWLPAPDSAFIDPSDPHAIMLGHAQRPDGSWAPIGIPYEVLRYGLWVTAPMGRGKTEYFKHLFAEFMRVGSGASIIDLKGFELARSSMLLVPLEREKDVVIIDLDGTVVNGERLLTTINLFANPAGQNDQRDLEEQIAAICDVVGLLSLRGHTFPNTFMTMGIAALLEGEPRATMQHLVCFFVYDAYRDQVCSKSTSESVQDFWRRETATEGGRAFIRAFGRQLAGLVFDPRLYALFAAPQCSIDMRELMDTGGILLAGISARHGKFASLVATLLLTQLKLAAQSRSNVPESQRPDWPVVIEEAQIVFEKNPGMAPVLFTQLRAMRIGMVVAHQNLAQIHDIWTVLAGNVRNRLILGAELEDATAYGNNYRALGMEEEDFLHMERFEHQYMRLYGTDAELFSARMPEMAAPALHEGGLEEIPPLDWRTYCAPATSLEDTELDRFRAELQPLLSDEVGRNTAIYLLGRKALEAPAWFAAYCARSRAHRKARRAYILRFPASIPDKEERIRTLSALKVGVPEIELRAHQWALVYSLKD